MSQPSYDKFLDDLSSKQTCLTQSIKIVNQWIVDAGNGAKLDVQQATAKIEEFQADLTRLITKATRLKSFRSELSKIDNWKNLGDRVIGHVVWAPPISISNPDKYTIDVCVIKPYNDKFFPSFRGNVIDLGALVMSDQRPLD